jgi:hypothetical protein
MIASFIPTSQVPGCALAQCYNGFVRFIIHLRGISSMVGESALDTRCKMLKTYGIYTVSYTRRKCLINGNLAILQYCKYVILYKRRVINAIYYIGGSKMAKSIREQGVTYYIIGNDYEGINRDVYQDFIHLDSLYKNDVNLLYDWKSGLCLAEDSVTLKRMSPRPLPALIFTKIFTDSYVYEWMHRNGEDDKINA